ncbi:MAG: CpaF family protein [Desulfarculaceae bacterium]|nr:CpaF family protein [Desulfarculaceae bacterium]MCF8071327.1 CpaF family protein [Desulfarculaceae bacterium]MCF8101652.1 CpaF family protein [Desulfarculaceae bacterium]MCF8116739.1 CpaF family protein [Desulfarculaceae bacterium]
MSLRQRLGVVAVGSNGQDQHRDHARESALQELKARIHYKVIESLDLSILTNTDDLQAEADLEEAIRLVVLAEPDPMSEVEREILAREIKHEVMGLGPLEPLLADDSISEILVNSFNSVFVERNGRLEQIAVRFRDNEHLLKIIDKIASAVGRRIDESSPMVDARLADGSRVNAIIPPLALDGPALSIRKFARDPLRVDDLVRLGSFSTQTAQFLDAAVKARLNMLISGGTGTGKTTLLNVLSSFIPHHERIVTIEDSAELQLQQEHIVRLETRPPNIEGAGEVAMRDLVKNSLRMRPDRIVVGEVRGGEALDMMQAMNTGHDGSLTTIHANSARDAIGRLETMISMAGLDIPDKAIRQQIASAIQIVIQVSRLADGSRRVTSVQEITGMETDTLTMQEIFRFNQTGIDERGRVQGNFGPTGIRPRWSDRIAAFGIGLGAELFGEETRGMP